jgi:hypothetical protein
MTLFDIGRAFGSDDSPSARGDGLGPLYGTGSYAGLLWDPTVVRGCFCDAGFVGANCGQPMCPKGPNPFTEGQQARVIALTVDLNGVSVTAGTDQLVRLRFLGAFSSGLDIGTLSTLSDADCATWVATHPFISTSKCLVTSVGDAYTLTIRLGWEIATVPHNNFFDHNGNPALAGFNCEAASVSSASITCSIADVNVLSAMTYSAGTDSGNTIVVEVVDDTSNPNTYRVTVGNTVYTAAAMSSTPAAVGALASATLSWGITWGHKAGARWTIDSVNTVFPPSYDEHDVCGGVGKCDTDRGTCICPMSATGVACSQKSTQADIMDTQTVSRLLAESSSYSGDILALIAAREASSSFNFFSATEGANAPLAVLSGDGRIKTRYSTTEYGSTVASGGLFIGGGGMTVFSGGLSMRDGPSLIRNTEPTTTALTIQSDTASFVGNVLRVATAKAASSTFHLMKADVDVGPASSTTLMYLQGDGLLELLGAGLKTSGAGAVTFAGSGGLTVSAGGSTLQVGTTIETTLDAPALAIKESHATPTSSIVTLEASRSADPSFKFLTVTATGTSQAVLTHHGSGLVQVHRGGLQIDGGGATITAGGLTVTGGVVDLQTGLGVSSGGATVTAGGLVVDDGGTLLENDGVANGHVIRSTSAALTSSEKVLSVESYTSSSVAPNHPLIWAGSKNAVGTMTERMSLTAEGLLHVSGYTTGGMRPRAYTLDGSGGDSVTLETTDCGAVVLAGATGAGNALVVTLPPIAMTDTITCTVTVAIEEFTRDVRIRNYGTDGFLHGVVLSRSGAGGLQFIQVADTTFSTNAGTGKQLRLTGIASGSTLPDVEGSYVSFSSVPGRGNGAWHITGAFGPWVYEAF